MKNIVKSYLKSCVPRFQMKFLNLKRHKDPSELERMQESA